MVQPFNIRHFFGTFVRLQINRAMKVTCFAMDFLATSWRVTIFLQISASTPPTSNSNHRDTANKKFSVLIIPLPRGVVRGIVVRSRSIFGTIGASFQTLVGGNITLWSKLCEEARQEAFHIMAIHAAEIGANAIIGMRYDATEIGAGVTEVLAYGTAVIVEQVRD